MPGAWFVGRGHPHMSREKYAGPCTPTHGSLALVIVGQLLHFAPGVEHLPALQGADQEQQGHRHKHSVYGYQGALLLRMDLFLHCYGADDGCHAREHLGCVYYGRCADPLGPDCESENSSNEVGGLHKDLHGRDTCRVSIASPLYMFQASTCHSLVKQPGEETSNTETGKMYAGGVSVRRSHSGTSAGTCPSTRPGT